MKVDVGFSPRVRCGVECVAERRLTGAEACALGFAARQYWGRGVDKPSRHLIRYHRKPY
jgi:hypothetical protein